MMIMVLMYSLVAAPCPYACTGFYFANNTTAIVGNNENWEAPVSCK